MLFFSHVQVNNDSAIKFYEKFGFEIAEEKKNYYKRIEPADAYVLQKSFREPKARAPGEVVESTTKTVAESSEINDCEVTTRS